MSGVILNNLNSYGLNIFFTCFFFFQGTSAAMPPMPLGLGPADNDFTIPMIIVVEDIYGSATEMTTSVRVSSVPHSPSFEMFPFLINAKYSA